MEGCSQTSAGAVAGLPDDLLVLILSRVPAKSICRFRCVSKAWRDLIADPHRKKLLPQPMQGLFIMRFMTPKKNSDDEEQEPMMFDHTSFRMIDLTGGLVPLGIDPSFSFLTKQKLPIQVLMLMDSCNGLVLFKNCPEMFTDASSYVVCNPTTEQWGTLPTCGSCEMITHIFLGFDPSVSSHFHLFQFQIPDFEKELISVHAYSSETRSWSRNRVLKQEEQGQSKGWRQATLAHGDPWCAFINGFLHLTVRDSDGKNKIAVVDVQGNATRMISVPEDTREVYFGQSQGRLHYMTRKTLDAYEELSIWVLQDSDTQEWVLKDTVSSLKLFGEKSCCTGRMSDTIEVIDIHQDCNTVFCIHYASHKLVAYNMDRKDVSVIGTFKDSDRWMGIGRYVPYFSELPALKGKHKVQLLR